MQNKKYLNKTGDSPITHYKIDSDRIAVWFTDGKSNPYVYPEYLVGSKHLKELKKHAVDGEGLSTYISQHVREKFIK